MDTTAVAMDTPKEMSKDQLLSPKAMTALKKMAVKNSHSNTLRNRLKRWKMLLRAPPLSCEVE